MSAILLFKNFTDCHASNVTRCRPAAFEAQSDSDKRRPSMAIHEQSPVGSEDSESDSGMSPLKPNLNRPVFEYEDGTDSDST